MAEWWEEVRGGEEGSGWRLEDGQGRGGPGWRMARVEEGQGDMGQGGQG